MLGLRMMTPCGSQLILNLLTKVFNEHVNVLTSCYVAPFAIVKPIVIIVVVRPLVLSVKASCPSVASGASAPIANTFDIGFAS